VLVMFDGGLSEDGQADVIKQAQEIIEKGSGTWLNVDNWGRRKFAYEIDHKREGSYQLVTFDSPPEALNELTRVLRITEGVVRHMAIRRLPETTAPSDAKPEAASA